MRLIPGALVLGLLFTAAPGAAQLRPLAPAEWHASGHLAACGVAYYHDIGVGLLGERGSLRSLGDCALGIDVGGVRIQIVGVAQRRFVGDSAYAAPVGNVDPELGSDRSDWGDLVVETVIPVRFDGSPWMAGVRFGSRVPITDDRIGLERDRTDLHMLVMGGLESGPVAAHVELGVGINGTRVHWREQQDVLVYGAAVEYGVAETLRLRVGALGHFKDRTERGNENRGEVRAGVRWGDGVWLDAEAIAGYTEASPSWGVRLRLGRHWRP